MIDSTSGLPVGIGFVVLLDTAGNELGRTITASDGSYGLQLPSGGDFRLRSERIGYRSMESDAFEVMPGDTLDYTLRVVAIPIVLSTVEVLGDDRCKVSPGRAAETAVVWEEIRKALAATAWDGTQELASYRSYTFERTLSSNRRQVNGERGQVLERTARQPYVSYSAEFLAREGYVIESPDSTVYNLPDPSVLMSDVFLDSHCFHVVRDSDSKPGQIGLAFEPIRQRGVSDVAGSLWLEEETSRLTALEVNFTRLPEGVEDERVGGTAEFTMLPSGAWIIQRWEVRTPVLQGARPANPFDRGPRRLARVSGFRDVGGELLEITTNDGIRVYPSKLAQLTGTVYDSTKGEPLQGVTVAIAETGFWAETDQGGSFHLTAPLSGEYSVELTHPWLDSVAYWAAMPVDLVRGQTRTVAVGIPHVRSALARLCPNAAGRLDFAALVGVVTRGRGSEIAGGADVIASWQIVETQNGQLAAREVEAVVEADEWGRYVLCGVPTGHPVKIRAHGGRAASRNASLIVAPTKDGAHLLAWNRDPSQAYPRSFAPAQPILKLDLELSESGAGRLEPEPRPVLSGFVTDRATGQPVGGVKVGVNGREAALSRDDGTFDIADVEWLEGPNIVALRRMGYQPWAQEIWLPRGESRLELSVSMQSVAIDLDPIEVTAVGVDEYLTDVGFYRRQQFNPGGRFIGREAIEERLGRAGDVAELLTGLVGVQVSDPGPGNFGASLYFQRGRAFGAMARGTSCERGVRILVDGIVVDMPVYAENNDALSEVVRPEEVYAIEVYRTPSQIPAQYGGAESACGVLLIWTRRGR